MCVPGRSTAAVQAVLDVEIEDSFEPSDATHARSVPCSSGLSVRQTRAIGRPRVRAVAPDQGAHDAIRIRPTASRYRDPGRNCRRRLRRVGWQVLRLGSAGIVEPRSTRSKPGPRAVARLRYVEASPCLRGDVNGAAVQNSDRLALGALITATCPLAGVQTALSRIPKP